MTILCFLGNTYAKERVSYFTTSDSIEIGYIQYGNENLTNMVFVHGGPGDNSSSFRKMAKQLSSDFRVTLFDFRGCGLSTRNLATKDLTIPNYVNDIKELLDHLEIDSSILLGHSFGGAIAVEFASIYPNRIKQLILSNPFTSGLTAQKNRFEQSYKLALDENDTIKINAYDQWLAGDSITIWDEAKMLDSRLLWHNPKIANRAFTYNYKSLGYSQEEFESGFIQKYLVVLIVVNV